MTTRDRGLLRACVLAISVAGCFSAMGCIRSREAAPGEKRAAFAPHAERMVGDVALRDHVLARTALLVVGAEPLAVGIDADGCSLDVAPGVASVSLASAALIATDGYLLTAAHAVMREPVYACLRASDGSTRVFRCRVVWRGDADTACRDLAVLRMSGDLAVPVFTWSARIPASGSIVIGRGIGFTAGACLGTESFAADAHAPASVVVASDEPTQDGDSGGPLVDIDGRLIAVQSRMQGTWSGHRSAAVRPDLGWLEALLAADRERTR